ncbi:hypothetical protein MY011_50220 [Escherichia coli]|nr:Mobile element protein [Escherichia coli]EII75134.1 transposase, mutator-like family protein [Escherichia coli 3.2303]OEI02931.1 hypothetical protein A9R45_22510 [Escherichia coli]OEI07527.1 hypothetical protein A9R47_11830 [Escherichia coli]OEI11764.1 hypothetical protein A9R46_00490 [Escherichia coli]
MCHSFLIVYYWNDTEFLTLPTELKNRGLNDILIACVDGQKGFPDAINTIYPEARIQLCMVHMVRNSQRFISWKDDIVGPYITDGSSSEWLSTSTKG